MIGHFGGVTYFEGSQKEHSLVCKVVKEQTAKSVEQCPLGRWDQSVEIWP